MHVAKHDAETIAPSYSSLKHRNFFAGPGLVSGWLALCVMAVTLVVSIMTAAVVTPRTAVAAGEGTNDGKNLNAFVTDVYIGDTKVTNSTFNAVEGEDVAIKIVFGETTSKQLNMDSGTKLVYTLPSGLTASNHEGTIDIDVIYYEDSTQKKITIEDNSYEIKNGSIFLEWNTSSAGFEMLKTAENTSFEIEFTGSFSGEGGKIDFGDGKKVTVEVDSTRDMKVQKWGSFNPSDGYMYYTLTVTSTGINTNVEVSDVLEGTKLTLDTDSITVTNRSNSSQVTGNKTTSANGFTYTFNQMNNGDVYEIKYRAKVDVADVASAGTSISADQMGNSATVKSQQDSDGERANFTPDQISYYSIGKSGTFDSGNNTITWKVYYNPECLVSMGGKTLTDTLQNPTNDPNLQVFGENAAVTVSRYTKTDTGADETYNYGGETWHYTKDTGYSDSVSLNSSTNSFNFTVPNNDTTPYMYVLEYTTTVDASRLLTTTQAKNTVTDENKTATGSVDVTPANAVEIKKKVDSWDDDQVNWEYTFDVPKGGLTSAEVVDSSPHAYYYDANSGQNTNLFDAFLVDGSSVPSNISVVDKYKSDSTALTIVKDTTEVGVQGYSIKLENNDTNTGTSEIAWGVGDSAGPKLTITFYHYEYKEGSTTETEKVLGFKKNDTGDHQVTVTLTTVNNTQWRAFYTSSDVTHVHTNRVSLNANGYTTTGEASVTIEDSGFFKKVANNGYPAYTVTLNEGTYENPKNVTYPVWQFMLFIVGEMPAEGFDVTETFKTDKFRLVTAQMLISSGIYDSLTPVSDADFSNDWGTINGTQVGHSNPANYTINRLGNPSSPGASLITNVAETSTGVVFHVTDANVQGAGGGDVHVIQYLLIPKDEATRDSIYSDGVTSAFTSDNTAKYGDHEEKITFRYQYNPGVKTVSDLMRTVKGTQDDSDPEGTVYDASLGNVTLYNAVKYELTINPDAQMIGTDPTIEAKDTIAGPQSIIYSTIQVTVDNAAETDEPVTWDVSGYAIDFHVPNGKTVHISYYTHLNADDRGEYPLSNELEVNGMTTVAKKTVSILETAAGRASLPTMYVLKHETGNMNAPLEGAVFALYVDQVPLDSDVTDSDGYKTALADNTGASAIATYRTGADGIATLAHTIEHPIHEYHDTDNERYTYFLREITAPEGYTANLTIYVFRIGTTGVPDYSNRIYVSGEQLKIANDQAEKGRLEIIKSVEGIDGLTSGQKQNITFTVQGLYDGSTSTYGYNKTFNLANVGAGDDDPKFDADGKLTLNDLEPGTYTVTETVETDGEVPGYTRTTTYSVTANGSTTEGSEAGVEAGKTTTVTVTNTYEENTETGTPVHGSVTLTKVEKIGETTNLLKGAEFTLYSTEAAANAGGNDDAITTYTTGDGGKVTISTDGSEFSTSGRLPAADGDPITYYLRETKAPAGYKLSSTPTIYTVTISASESKDLDTATNKFIYTTTYTITINGGTAIEVENEENRENTYKHTSVTLTKVDAADTDHTLNNATFTLYGDAACMQVLGEFDAGIAESSITISTEDNAFSGRLPEAGSTSTFYLKETEAPTGYELPDKVIQLTVSAATAKRKLDETNGVWQYETTYTISIVNSDAVIFDDATATTSTSAKVPNTARVGELHLTKAVTLDGVATNSALTDGSYTITVTGPTAAADQVTRTVVVTMKGGVLESAKVDDTADENAKENGYVTIGDLKPGTYAITEVGSASSNNPYAKYVDSSDDSVTIEPGGTATATVTNNVETGSLTLTKTLVSSLAADENRSFTFTVTLSSEGDPSFVVNGTYGDMTFADNVATVTITPGAPTAGAGTATGTATATGLPAGMTYTIVEDGASSEGFAVTPESATATGTIVSTKRVNEEHEPPAAATFTNTRDTGGFTIAKELDSTLEVDETHEFEFTITLSDNTISGNKGTNTTHVDFTNGVATVKLKGGESASVSGLPVGVTYTVTEKYELGFTTEWTNKVDDTSEAQTVATDYVQGAIVKDGNPTITAKNTRETGSLTISKTLVSSATGDAHTDFSFTVTLSDTNINQDFNYAASDGDAATDKVNFQNGVGTVTIKGGESRTITGLPAGISYEVTEAPNDDFASSASDSAKGTITKGGNPVAAFTNVRHAGGLSVVKHVDGASSDSDKEFSFTITLERNDFTGGVLYGPTSGSGQRYVAFTRNDTTSTASFTLKDGEVANVVKSQDQVDNTDQVIPEGTKYTVEETNQATGYTVISTDATGTIKDRKTSIANFTNTAPGALTITKAFMIGGTQVTATSADDRINGTYTFTVTGPTDKLSEAELAEHGTKPVTITVTDGKPGTATVSDLVPGRYTITETSSNNPYVPVSTESKEVVVLAGVTTGTSVPNAKITNTYLTGNLRITKVLQHPVTVADQQVEFTFKVSLYTDRDMTTLADISGTYGAATFAHGVATGITVKGSNSVLLQDIPAGLYYKVEETNIPTGFSQVEAETTNTTGQITGGANNTDVTQVATFTNERDRGNLTISKTAVPTTGGPYNFTVTLSDRTISGNFGTTTDRFTFTNGIAHIQLSNGQSLTATGLPTGVTYTVTEDGFAGTTIWTGNTSGTITKNTTATVAAKNYETGSLLITKAVTLDGVTTTDSRLNGTYTFTVEGPLAGSDPAADSSTETVAIVIEDGVVKAGAVDGSLVTLVEDGSTKYVEVTGLKPGNYRVTEAAPSGGVTLASITGGNHDTVDVSGRSVTAVVASGASGANVVSTGRVTFTNNAQKGVGSLVLAKALTIDGASVAAGDGRMDGDYEFTVVGPADADDPTTHRVVFTVSGGVVSAATVDGAAVTPAVGGSVEIANLKPGTYTVTEVSSSNPHVSVDGTARTIDVVENLTGSSAPKLTVTNNLDTGSLVVSKTVDGEHTGSADAEFGFTVRLTNGADISGEFGGMTFEKGVATFTLKNGESLTATGLPVGVTYTVQETSMPDGFAQSARTTGASGTIAKGATATAAVHNVYAPQTSIVLTAKKTLAGATLEAGQFSFEVVGPDGEVIQTVTNAADGSVTFDALGFTVEDAGETYTYTIREVIPADAVRGDDGSYTKDGITYDGHAVAVQVKVVDEDGKLTAEATYEGGSAVFANTYTPTPETPASETPAPKGAVPRTGDTALAVLPPFLLAVGLALGGIGTLLRRSRKQRPHGAHMRV